MELAEGFFAASSTGNRAKSCKYGFRNLCWWGRGKSLYSLKTCGIFREPYPLIAAYIHSLGLHLIYTALFLPHSCLISPSLYLPQLSSQNKQLFWLPTLTPEPEHFPFCGSYRNYEIFLLYWLRQQKQATLSSWRCWSKHWLS